MDSRDQTCGKLACEYHTSVSIEWKHFRLCLKLFALPFQSKLGPHCLVFSSHGYKAEDSMWHLQAQQTINFNFDLQEKVSNKVHLWPFLANQNWGPLLWRHLSAGLHQDGNFQGHGLYCFEHNSLDSKEASHFVLWIYNHEGLTILSICCHHWFESFETSSGA